ncbi:MAG: class I SAM-dependent methyltransferase, partial [Planctomycetes bacterium]|nr:class I SAM-dependent methyltransferase [Planctomycetota bacterium]
MSFARPSPCCSSSPCNNLGIVGLVRSLLGASIHCAIQSEFNRLPTPANDGESLASSGMPLARAIGLHRGVQSIVDATAGLGRDAVTLAARGCRVTAIERSGVLAALLRDGLARATAAEKAWLRDIAERVTLVVGDARDTLRDMTGTDAPDAVYLDPMYAEIDTKYGIGCIST